MTDHTPAQAARLSGFSLDTLRYYERIGLLGAVRRDDAGRRVYSDQDLDWLGMVRCLRDTGMPIQQMRRYAGLALGRTGDSVAERVELLEEHAERVDETIALLRRQQEHLAGKIAYYRSVLAEAPSTAARA